MLPRGTSHKVTDEIIDLINSMEDDTGLIQEYLEESLLSHLPVLKKVKVDLVEYVNAIKFCNLKKAMTNDKAWQIVFPEKYDKLIREDRWNSSHVSMYNGSTLVTKLDAQMMLTVEIQYAPLFHSELMRHVKLADGISSNGMPVSANIQQVASAKILDIVMPKESQEIHLKIGQSDESKAAQEGMYVEMRRIAQNQQELLKAGHSIEEVQKLNMKIEVVDEEELIEVDIEED
jgi:hypothetical protein